MTTVSRVPFSREDEHTIVSMARWMRFMAVVGIVGAVIMLVLLVVAAGWYTTAHDLTAGSPRWQKLDAFLSANGLVVYGLAAAFLLAAGVGLWQNLTLYHAGDDFNVVARTDQADVDFLAHGLDKLRTFFKVQVVVVFVMLAAAFAGGIVVALMLRHV